MISVIQRVTRASVTVAGSIVGQIGPGLVALTAVHATDTDDDLRRTADKLLTLRVFPFDAGDGSPAKAYHLDLTQHPGGGGGMLVVSNFTVAAITHEGRRPALHPAAPPAVAKDKFAQLVALLRARYPHVQTGEFGADMHVEIHNDGPLTVIFDTRS